MGLQTVGSDWAVMGMGTTNKLCIIDCIEQAVQYEPYRTGCAIWTVMNKLFIMNRIEQAVQYGL